MLPQIMPLSWIIIMILLFLSFYSLLILVNSMMLSFKKNTLEMKYSFKKITW